MSRFDSYYSAVIERAMAKPSAIPQYPSRLYYRNQSTDVLSSIDDMSSYVACATAPNPKRLAACVAAVVDTATVAGWALPSGRLPDFNPCARTLVVALQGEFLESIFEMSSQRPSVTVQSDVDMNGLAPYLCWRANLVDETEVDILVPIALLATAIAKMGKRSDVGQWVPTVFVVGDVIAAGGFHLDEHLAARCRNARRHVRVNGPANAPRPMEPHVRRFVERYGLAPWKFGRFRDEGTFDPDLLLATPWSEAP